MLIDAPHRHLSFHHAKFETCSISDRSAKLWVQCGQHLSQHHANGFVSLLLACCCDAGRDCFTGAVSGRCTRARGNSVATRSSSELDRCRRQGIVLRGPHPMDARAEHHLRQAAICSHIRLAFLWQLLRRALQHPFWRRYAVRFTRSSCSCSWALRSA